MKLNNRFIFGILSLLLAAVIAFVALPTIARQTNGKEEIVRITQPVLKGEQISSENAEVVEVGGYNLPSNIAHQLSDVNGLYATADLAVGDYILTSKISSVPVSSDVALNSIPSGKVAISLTSSSPVTSSVFTIFLIQRSKYRNCVLSKYCPLPTQTASMWIMPRNPRRMKKSSSRPPSLCWQALNRRRSLPVLKMTA